MTYRRIVLVSILSLLLTACTGVQLLETPTPAPAADAAAEADEMAAMQPGPDDVYGKSPWWPWLSAHIGDESPPSIVGGPITLTGVQESGGANFLLPGPRELDPTIFGTAENPKGTETPPIVLGVPENMRTEEPEGGLMTAGPTPFGDNVATVPGSVRMTLVDATATDGASTEDQIDFEATFQSPNGEDEYRVEVKMAASHGMFIPTGGGVVTNFMQHGVSGWGTRLMPTLYSYVSFWGMGDIYMNDELIAEGRVVHGMHTEFVRESPYELVFDEGVDPNGEHFHLMIPPVTPTGEPSPIPTGFELPNGQELPFFHIMFPTVDWMVDVNGEAVAQMDLPYNSLPTSPEMMEMAQAADAPYRQSPWWPWISAHFQNEAPPQLLTGPIEVTLNQPEGNGANFLLPGPRELDPTIFGMAENPTGTETPPIVLGVPAEMRTEGPEGGLMTAGPTPFGDTVRTVEGSLQATLVDATAMDGARTQDTIDFTATFAAPNGTDTYRVEVKRAAPHGWFNPTGGGVITNFMQHGVTGWGTRLMPTLYSYLSFWGLGTIYKNDEVIAENRVVHGMHTEFVRKAPYDLVFDKEVNPNATHFHLMIAPVDPFGNPAPVPTGFELPNGQELPFFHVMFPVTQATARALGTQSAQTEGAQEAEAAAEATATPVQTEASGDIREIEVTARQPEFSPNEFTLTVGEPVRFLVASEDIFHTFTVKEDEAAEEKLLNANIFPDRVTTVEWTPTEAGDYYLHCIPHEGMGMTGTIHVVAE